MPKLFEPFILTFIPLFVAVDSIGNLPLFVSLVDGLNKKQKDKAIIESVTTAAILAVVFMFVGKWVLRLLGITIPDFQIAGGALLFVISLRLLLPGASKSLYTEAHNKEVGVFPLGTPLITGPAVLTTTLILLDQHGTLATFTALILNMFIVWITFIKADFLMKIFGANGTRAFSKIMYILLAAISIMMIRKGIMGVLVP
ncbi:MAG TPA: MarC family protein [Candidatus Omnitrophota bacterium]|nr:MarC family protein [Candidatus Omnitrophota bacterium]HPT07608.1 MarC family protein [Candidatus Omnitrophota bacterium]